MTYSKTITIPKAEKKISMMSKKIKNKRKGNKLSHTCIELLHGKFQKGKKKQNKNNFFKGALKFRVIQNPHPCISYKPRT